MAQLGTEPIERVVVEVESFEPLEPTDGGGQLANAVVVEVQDRQLLQGRQRRNIAQLVARQVEDPQVAQLPQPVGQVADGVLRQIEVGDVGRSADFLGDFRQRLTGVMKERFHVVEVVV